MEYRREDLVFQEVDYLRHFQLADYLVVPDHYHLVFALDYYPLVVDSLSCHALAPDCETGFQIFKVEPCALVERPPRA